MSASQSESRSLRSSREAKRRRTGTCEDCGGVTRYAGNKHAVSRFCVACAAKRVGAAQRGTGATQARVLAYIGDGERRFMEIVNGAGITKDIACSVMHRLLKYGLVERPRRGVYRKADA